MKEQTVNELDQFPSLQAFGHRLDELAEHDHRLGSGLRRRARGLGWLRLGAPRRLAPTARVAAVLGLVAAIAGATYAAPVTRAAVDDAFSTLSGWVAGDGGVAPGRAVGIGEDVPPWVAAEDGEKRVLAEAGGEKLVAIREGDQLTLALAGSATAGTVSSYRERLSGQQIVLAGAGRFLPNGRHDQRPIFGLVSASVKRIQYEYADGTPPVFEENLAGAFGIVIETNRRPSSLTGYDQAGKPVARFEFVADPQGVSPAGAGKVYYGVYRYCPWRGCTPWIK